MRIRFLKTRTVQAADGETYEEGKTYELAEASAKRWISRGVALDVTEAEAAAAELKAEEEAAAAAEKAAADAKAEAEAEAKATAEAEAEAAAVPAKADSKTSKKPGAGA